MVDDELGCYIRWNGTKVWRQGDYLHRQDGPALEYPDGDVEWWLRGYTYTFDEFLEQTPISPEAKCMLKLRYG